MKRKLFLAVLLFLAITVVVAWNVNTSLKADGMLSDVALANVEALAQTELTPDGWVCFENVRDDGGDWFFIVQWCGDCRVYSATNVIGGNYCWYN